MKKVMKKPLLLAPLAVAVSMASAQVYAESDSITDAVKNGKADLSFRMRYEDVNVDVPSGSTAKDNAHATTLKTRLTFNTDTYQGVGMGLEFDDVSKVDKNLYNDTVNGHPGPVIADPEGTEINQAFLSYNGLSDTLMKYGRQRIILDNQRFVGGVGFRQNEQTYDSFSLNNKSLKDTTIFYSYIYNIQRIFGEDSTKGNTKTNTNLINVKYDGLSFGSITGYAYLIDNDKVLDQSSDTYGVRFSGKTGEDIKYLYTAELATQSEAGDNPVSYDAGYMLLEGGVVASGVTAKLGYELLGSDDEAENEDGSTTSKAFQTPLATLHKFQGWTDQFLGTPGEGIADVYASVGGTVAGIKLMAVAHAYTSDEKNAAGDDDLGSEIGFVVAKKFDAYGLSLKYSDYSAGDDTFTKGGDSAWDKDTDKLWLTATAKF